MKYIFLTFSFILIFYNICLCQIISDWIIIDGQAPAQNITTEQAIKKAIESAKRNAIEKFCGVNIRSQSFVQDFKLGVDIIESISYGYVVEAETLSINREDFRRSPKESFIDLIKVKMKVKVAKSNDKPDPYFKINASINKSLFMEGEMIELIVESSKDCYINIFNITEDGKLYQIYPLYKFEDIQVKAGETWKYPQPLMAACLPDYNENSEIIKIIATQKQINFFEFSDDEVDFEIIQGMKVWIRAEFGFEQLAKTIISIPMSDRTEKTLAYKIFKK